VKRAYDCGFRPANLQRKQQKEAATSDTPDTAAQPLMSRPLTAVDLPDIDVHTKAKGMNKTLRMLPVIIVLTLLIGWGVAELIYHYTGDKAAYDAKIAVLKTNELYFLYFSAVILGRLTVTINSMPLVWKSSIMLAGSGNLRANMYIYKVAHESGEAGAPGYSHVLLDEQGDVGKYNRANRSLHHYTENLAPFFLGVPLASYVFPAATFVLVCIFAIGRVWHQTGYATKGYGAHGGGFALAMLATVTLEGLMLSAGFRAAGAFA